MSKIVERVIISLLCLNGILLLFILISFIYFPAKETKEIIFIPVRPPLTHPDPREALIIKGTTFARKKEANGLKGYSPRQILEGLALLRKGKGQLLNKEQAHKILPCLRRISYCKKRIGYLNGKVEEKKRGLELACVKMGKVLKWNQLDFVISNIDLFTLEIYEFPCWLELLSKIKIKSESAES